MCLNYGGRDEIVRAVKRFAAERPAEALTEQGLTDHLDTAGIPDPDVVIRTSGEKRLSNYMLWQAAYSEFVFTDTLWPDFRKESYLAALKEYAGRDRRFGKVK